MIKKENPSPKMSSKKIEAELRNTENILNIMATQPGKSSLWKIMGQINFSKHVAGEGEKLEKIDEKRRKTYKAVCVDLY